MSSDSINNDFYLSLLQIDGKGWNSSLFVDKSKLSTFLCKACHNVCRDAVELGCDHDNDKVISSYCTYCLTELLNENNNICPINSSHQNASFHSSRIVRSFILKLMVYCPYSIQYKNIVNRNNDKQIIDSNEEKEGIKFIESENKNICEWRGTFNELLTNHIMKCPAETKDIINKKIDKIRNEMDIFAVNLKEIENKIDIKTAETKYSIQSLQTQFDNLSNNILSQQREQQNQINSLKQQLQQQNHDIMTIKTKLSIDSVDNEDDSKISDVIPPKLAKLPQQLILIVVRKNQSPKKVILKKKNGYTIKALDNELKRRLKLKDNNRYWIKLENDTIIKTDQDIVEKLTVFKTDQEIVCHLVPK